MDLTSDDKNWTVMVVDDDRDQRLVIGRWLENAGHRPIPMSSGEQAILGLRDHFPDMVCLDLHMPGLDGIETLQRIRTGYPLLPVVILTADSTPEAIVATMKLGAYDYLTKPIDKTKLLTTVRNACAHHRMAQRVTELEREVEGWPHSDLIGRSPPMKLLFRQISRVAPSDASVLVEGESGVGKELVAKAIHDSSPRARGPFVAVNCAAIPQGLQESELFGHEKGSFTGATTRRIGCFERANNGTLFLDEVGELTPDLQAKLLRVIQERVFYRVGGNREITSDFRLIAATHRDLDADVQAGRFRQDLYFRIAVCDVAVPPLRDRGEDLHLLAETFAVQLGEAHDGRARRVSSSLADLLPEYSWPGNVRELRNAIHRAVVMSSGTDLLATSLPPRVVEAARRPAFENTVSFDEPPPPVSVPSQQDSPPPPGRTTLSALERRAVAEALEAAGGNVSKAARTLGISRTTLYRKLRQYDENG